MIVDVYTTWTILVGIFFPSVTGELMLSNSQILKQVKGEDDEKQVVAGDVSILEGSYPFLSQEIFSVHPSSIAAMRIVMMMLLVLMFSAFV